MNYKHTILHNVTIIIIKPTSHTLEQSLEFALSTTLIFVLWANGGFLIQQV